MAITPQEVREFWKTAESVDLLEQEIIGEFRKGELEYRFRSSTRPEVVDYLAREYKKAGWLVKVDKNTTLIQMPTLPEEAPPFVRDRKALSQEVPAG